MKNENNKPYIGNVLQNPKYVNETKEVNSVKTTSALNTQTETVAHNDRLNRFAASQGQGYAAEQYNDLIDKLHGRKATILGDDNKLNGADRMVDGKLIQTKYCQTAQDSVNAAFKNGQYRYLDDNGKPMQLEVPTDQYEQAVESMRKKIAEGKVPGTTNPDDAEKIVRKGNVTYKQAVQVAKAGTIESLKFDAVHGIVVATSAFGISSVITFAKALWEGEESSKAIEIAMYNGLKMGGVAFVTSVLTAQLTRTGLNNFLLGPSIEVVKLLPSSVRNVMVNAMREGASIYGAVATNNLAKLLRGNIIASGVFILVISASDITNMFRGRISGKQLFKNVMTLVSGIASAQVGAIGGAAIGSLIPIPGAATAGYYIGGLVGGTAGGSASNAVMNSFIEDDAIEMVRILNERFVVLAQEYLLSEEEIELVLSELRIELEQVKLLQMFASNDRYKFADEMLTNIIEKIVCWRVHIMLPTDTEMVEGLGRVCEMCVNGIDVEKVLAKTKVDTVAIGRQLLGRELSVCAASKAWYVTKQMNIALMQQECCLKKMSANEKEYAIQKQNLDREVQNYKNELNQILGDY